jgi:uncharacterized membrane protein (UPF0127 family)
VDSSDTTERTDRLVVDGRIVAPIEMTAGFGERGRGLLGRDGADGALLLRRTSSIHTLGMRFSIDVAFCDRDLTVVAVRRLDPGHLSRPRLHARTVIEAEAGAFDRWGLRPGSCLGVISEP